MNANIENLIASISQFAFGGGLILLIITLLFYRPRTRNMNNQADSVAVETANTVVTTLREQLNEQQQQINELTEQLNRERQSSAELRRELNQVKDELSRANREIDRLKEGSNRA